MFVYSLLLCKLPKQHTHIIMSDGCGVEEIDKRPPLFGDNMHLNLIMHIQDKLAEQS